MNDETEGSDRLEKLLRGWGAAEAIRQREAGPSTKPSRRKPGAVWTIMRTTAVAAALLMAVGVCVFIGRNLGPRPRREEEPATAAAAAAAAAAQARIAELQTQLAAAREQLDQVSNTLRQLAEKNTKAAREHARELERLNDELARHRGTSAQLAKLQEEITGLKAAMEAERNKAAAAAKELSQLRITLRRAQEEAALAKTSQAKKEEALVDLRRRLAAAANELARLGKAHRQVLAQSQKADEQLAMIKVRQGIMLATFERMYLATAAGGQDNWRARQTAARTAKLLGRYGEIRPQVKSPPTAQLVEKLEVILIRLDLLNPGDAVAVNSFADLVAGSGLTRQIDEVLTGGEESPQVQGWLLEARLIIMGANRVG